MLSSRNNTLEFSSGGSILLNGGAVSSGRFGAIQILQDTVIDYVVANNVDQTTHVSYDSKSFNAGTILYGDFTTVSVTSGLVALHRV